MKNWRVNTNEALGASFMTSKVAMKTLAGTQAIKPAYLFTEKFISSLDKMMQLLPN